MRLILIIFLLLNSILLQAKDVPYLSGRVVDEGGILSEAAIQELNKILKQHEDSTTNQIAVLIIQSLEGEILEEYSLNVANTWALGTKQNDNGVLLLIAIEDRKLRIEVGEGLEGVLTDVTSNRIIRNEITPNFRQENYEQGVLSGVNAIISALQGEYVSEESSALSNPADDMPLFARIFTGLIFLLVVGTFTFMALFAKGCAGWGIYLFLMPFYLTFPLFIFGVTGGLILFAIYAVGFILMKLIYFKTTKGQILYDKMAKNFKSTGGSSGSGWSSGGGGFSGGGGSFSGGGSSGSW